MTESADLLDLHIAALFTQDEHGRLVATNEPEPDQVIAPRLYLGRSDSGCVLRFRRGMKQSTCAALRDLAAPELMSKGFNSEPVNRAAIEEILAAEQAIERVYFGPTFRFPDSLVSAPEVTKISSSNTQLLVPGFTWLADQLAARNPVVAMVVGGTAVSVCYSARVGPDASEAGVETLPEYRRRGCASAVAVAWAAAVRLESRIPLYSTWWENRASRRLVCRLGLIQYGTDFHIA